MKVGNTLPFFLPHPAAFRPWVRACVTTLEVSPASLSRQLGLGRNTIGDFLGNPGRSIDMTTAHVLTCKLCDLAAKNSVLLPEMEAPANA